MSFGGETEVGVVDGECAVDGVVVVASVDVDIAVFIAVIGKFRHCAIYIHRGALALGQGTRQGEIGGDIAEVGVVEEGAEGDMACR